MILCEREIQALVKRKLVLIEGCPGPDSKRWSSTALDLTLHNVILEWDVTSAPPTGGARARSGRSPTPSTYSR